MWYFPLSLVTTRWVMTIGKSISPSREMFRTWLTFNDTIITLIITSIKIYYRVLLLAGTFSQEFLNSLLFFQQESPNNPLLDTTSTATSSISTWHGLFTLFQIFVCRALEVLDSRQGGFAVWASWSFGGFDDFLRYVTSTGGADGSDAVGLCVVGVTSWAGYSVVWHSLFVVSWQRELRCYWCRRMETWLDQELYVCMGKNNIQAIEKLEPS